MFACFTQQTSLSTEDCAKQDYIKLVAFCSLKLVQFLRLKCLIMKKLYPQVQYNHAMYTVLYHTQRKVVLKLLVIIFSNQENSLYVLSGVVWSCNVSPLPQRWENVVFL